MTPAPTMTTVLKVRVDRDTMDALGRLAGADGRSVSWVARAALRDYLDRHAHDHKESTDAR